MKLGLYVFTAQFLDFHPTGAFTSYILTRLTMNRSILPLIQRLSISVHVISGAQFSRFIFRLEDRTVMRRADIISGQQSLNSGAKLKPFDELTTWIRKAR